VPGCRSWIKTDLRDLQYTFTEKGLIETPMFMQWVDSIIKTAQARLPAPPAASRPM
jgi:hypothetical protein